MQEFVVSEGCFEGGDFNWVKCGFFVFECVVEVVEEMLLFFDWLMVIFVVNDEMVFVVYFVVSKLGLWILEDLLVVGFDDVLIVQIIWFILIIVVQFYEEMICVAVEKLIVFEGYQVLFGVFDVLILGYEIKFWYFMVLLVF